MQVCFYPQTIFYIIKNEIDYLNDIDFVNDTYNKNLLQPLLKPWELGFEFSCEDLLAKCVKRNKLKKR